MYRRVYWVALLLTVLTVGSGLWPETAQAEDAPHLNARAAVLMEWSTGTVLYGLRAHEKRDPASLTKIMTAIVALEHGSLQEPVRVSRYAAWTPGSIMGLEEGQEYSLKDLLYGLMLESGNDAAVAIAEHIAGDERAFAHLMTDRAHQLGALSTEFRNPHGLTEPGHQTTAYDLALISRYAMALPLFTSLVGTRDHQVDRIDDPTGGRMLQNTNRLLWSYAGAEGIKTGTTSAAGPCLVTAATRDGMRLLVVVLDSADRWGDTVALLDWGFNNFTLVKRGGAGQFWGELRVSAGVSRRVALVLARDLVAVVRKADLPGLEVRGEVAREVRAPIRKGQPLGRLTLVVKDHPATDRSAADGPAADGPAAELPPGEALLVADTDVPARSLFWILWQGLSPVLRWLHAVGLT